MEGHCSTGQNSQWAVVPMEEEVSAGPLCSPVSVKRNVMWLTNSISTNKCTFCILRILLLIDCYMFRHNCHPQGASTNVVITYSNNIVLQWSYISSVVVVGVVVMMMMMMLMMIIIIIKYYTMSVRGIRWRSWLKHCATSRKVEGSIRVGVKEIIHWLNPSGHAVALKSIQPLTKMSTRNISCGFKAAVA